EDVLKEWFIYFYQCTECRRCSLFCPYGIDTAEITMMARELLHLCGVNINWILEPVSNCNRTGNHLGIQPHAFKDIVDFMVDDIEEITDPGIYTFMGYLMLFDHIGLDYTLSTYASEGGNFGLFTSADMMKKLNAKMYAEADRLGAKWILGGECGH
ncbi:(Fe-S)-binding protein, partial [Aduncisulcus paluster]